MNKKILSFVLAMVLAVGLGCSSLFYAAENNFTNGGGTNSGLLQSNAGSRVITSGVSALVERISQTFNYEHGILTYATGADGTITLYDRGQYRMTLKIGAGGEYEVADLATYGTDLAYINSLPGANDAEKFDNWQRAWGVTESQLKGGSKSDQDIKITEEEYKTGKAGPKAGEYEKKTEDGKDVYYHHIKGNDAYHVKWNDPETGNSRAMDHLKGGINTGVRINYSASNGASLTLLTNGKAFETYSYDNELITKNTYIIENGQNGVITDQAEEDLVQKKDGSGKVISTSADEYAKADPENYKKAWSRTKTLGGKVVSCVQLDDNGNVMLNNEGEEIQLKKYEYGLDGNVSRVLDFVNGTITIYTPQAVITLSQLGEKDDQMDLSKVSNERLEGLISDAKHAAGTNSDLPKTTGFYISSVQVYNLDTTIDYAISRTDEGKTTTSVYIHNIVVATADGVVSSGYLRDWYNSKIDYILHGGEEAEKKLQGYEDCKDFNLTGDIIKKIIAATGVTNTQSYSKLSAADKNKLLNSPVMQRLVKSFGWDIVEDRIEAAWDLLADAWNCSGGAASVGLTVTFADTAYSQEEIEKLSKGDPGAGDDINVSPIVNYNSKDKSAKGRFVKTVTVMHHNARSVVLNFADFDSSACRAAYIEAKRTFSDDMMSSSGNGVADLTPTTSINKYKKAMDSIEAKISAELTALENLALSLTPTTGGTKAEALNKMKAKIKAQVEAKLKALNKKYFKDPNKIKINLKWDEIDKGTKKTRTYNGVYERVGQATHEETVSSKTTYTVTAGSVDFKKAFKELTKEVRNYINSFITDVTGGSLGTAAAYHKTTFSKDVTVALNYSKQVDEVYKLVDPVTKGVPTVSKDGNTLTFGAGSTIDLLDGKGPRTLQEGEELVIDISSLDPKVKASVIAAAKAGKTVMCMFDITGVDKKNGTVYGKANKDYKVGNSGGGATADPAVMNAIEKQIAQGGGDIGWLDSHQKQNTNILKDFVGNWIDGCDELRRAYF